MGGYLKGYAQISAAAGHEIKPVSKMAFIAFQNECCDLIIKAYRVICTPSSVEETLNEPNISANLNEAIGIVADRDGHQCSIIPEAVENTDAILLGEESTLKAKKYDLYLESFQGKEKVKYGVEAKLLLESDYKGRSQSTLIAEYISSKGMRKFIDRKYRKRGCMIGYIMQGNPSKILENINKKIRSTSPYKSDESEILKPQDFGLDFDHCYESEHPQDDSDEKLRLRHLLLSFS